MMFALDDPTMQSRAAALLRSAANDLKRDDATAEAELGLPSGFFAALTSGALTITWDLIERAVQVWPLNERDLLAVHDDCPDGVGIVRTADSIKSSRVIDRGGRPYYEYRDTAMSRVASFRPERIRMLVTADGRAEDPSVQWKNGHLLYQFTYLVGPVNYYYEWEGVRHCVRMTTGDSVWGVPFGRHSFTSRDPAEPAYILALTYGGGLVGDAQRELAVLGVAMSPVSLHRPVCTPSAQNSRDWSAGWSQPHRANVSPRSTACQCTKRIKAPLQRHCADILSPRCGQRPATPTASTPG